MRALTTWVFALATAAALPAAAQRPGQGEDDSAALVGEGRAALRAGKLDEAAKALDQAIALNPRRVEAYVLRSAVHAARKQFREGVALMRRAQQLSPTDEEVLTSLGSQLVLAGEAREGVPLLAQVVAANPKRYDAQLLLGRHYHATARWADAVTALEAYFANRPAALAREDARHQIELADAHLRARHPAKARELFERAAAARGDDLRARIGVAWSAAALDCKQARPLLRDLEPIAAAHPEVWLVDGQCALALGDPGAAIALGRRYLDKVARGSAPGHALVGEAHAARGNLAEARRELDKARELEPTRRRWTVRFAAVLRRANDVAGALAALDQLGPPAQPAADPAWWTELGETLLAKGEAGAVVARLTPVVAELSAEAPVRVVLGAAQLATGKVEPAVTTLTEAEAIASTPRGRKLLAQALTAVAVGKLTTGDPAGAEPLLERADKLDGTPLVWRNLGIARLALDRPKDALLILDRAAKADPAPVIAMLAARARALSGDPLGARPLYERALAGERDPALSIEIALDWAASELAGGDPAIAVAALEKVAPAAGAGKVGALGARHKGALADARHAAGVAALRGGAGARAVELLRAAAAAEPSLAKRCDLALATVVATDTNAALAALRAVSGQSCPFPPPADTQAAPILIAFTEGLSARRAGRSLDRLTALAGKSSGPAAVLLNTSLRVVALEAARDAYAAGKLAQVRKFLTTARGANTRIGNDEVAHDLAVVDLLEGRLDAAIVQLERVAPRVPEALVNLGIAYERKGEPVKALEAWRRARKANARFAPLADWIEAKERIYGDAP